MESQQKEQKTYFITDELIRVPAVDSKQMREIDRIAMEETGPNLYQMMENAGRNLATQTMELLAENWKDANIVVLAGTGGNGGGGICSARHLANRGANVALCLSNPEKLAEVPAFQLKVYRSTSGKEITTNEIAKLHPDFIIDALIGYSLRSAPRGPVLDLIKWANDSQQPVVSLDIPSGVDATSGETAGEYIRATHTLTLALPKTGLINQAAGNLLLADIGIPKETYTRVGLQYLDPFGEKDIVHLNRIERTGN